MVSDVVTELRALLDRPGDPDHLGYGWTTEELSRVVQHLGALLDVAEEARGHDCYTQLGFNQGVADGLEQPCPLCRALARLDGKPDA